jgi:hypothetical protein
VIWAFQAALPGYIGGSLIQDQPWLAMVFGFFLSAVLAGGIALAQRWWDRRQQVEVEVPIKPAVVGIGGVDAEIASRQAPAEAAGHQAEVVAQEDDPVGDDRGQPAE